MIKSSYWLTVVTLNPIPRSEYARHATDLFTILQNTLISNRVIQNLTKTNRILRRVCACISPAISEYACKSPVISNLEV